MVQWVHDLEPMPLKVLGSPNHAVGVVVVSVAWVFLVDLEVAHFRTVGADSPWKELRRVFMGLKVRNRDLKVKIPRRKGHASHQTYTTAWEMTNIVRYC